MKTKLNKKNFEILRNIEMICFINPGLLEEYSKFLKKNLKHKEEVQLYIYLKKNWLDKNFKIFNYYKLIKDSNQDNSKILNHIFLTNNISESLHSKINYYIPRSKMTSFVFINAIKNFLFKNELKTNIIKRRDYISKTLIKFAKDITDSKDFKWITHENFIKEQKKIIHDENENLNMNLIEDIISNINNIECIEVNNSKNDQNALSEIGDIKKEKNNIIESMDKSQMLSFDNEFNFENSIDDVDEESSEHNSLEDNEDDNLHEKKIIMIFWISY